MINFNFLQMPLFNKQEHELETHFDKWVYFLKNLENFDHIPSVLNEPIFQRGFEIAELSHLTPRQFDAYQKSLLEYSEVKNVSDTSFEDGEKKGIEKGKIEGIKTVAKALKAQGVSIDIIMASTGLTKQEIE